MKDVKPNETFTLETEEGEQLCKVITTMYAEDRKKYYLVYEYVPENGDIYVSYFDPDDEEGNLIEVTNEKELQEIAKFLSDFEGDEE